MFTHELYVYQGSLFRYHYGLECIFKYKRPGYVVPVIIDFNCDNATGNLLKVGKSKFDKMKTETVVPGYFGLYCQILVLGSRTT